jgi:tRNA(Ile)-lysidine synthase
LNLSVQAFFEEALQQNAQGFLLDKNKQTRALCVAYSGGLDSTVLLELAYTYCNKANIPLYAVHVNHGISAYADDWQKHCQAQCLKRNIPFYSESLNVKKLPQQSLEALARDARYQVLDKYAGVDKIVLLAQHQNDQAETLLIQLKRGAGVKGLSAMPHSITKQSGVKYLRPLLELTRKDLHDFATKHKLSWVEDESNQDNTYDRNFLRNEVLPLLISRWPSFNKTVARSARHCGQADIVNTEYMELLSKSVITNKSINLRTLYNYSHATQECFIRYWLSTEYGLSPTSAQLGDIVKMSKVSNNSDERIIKTSSPHIVISNNVIERYKETLLVVPLSASRTINADNKSLFMPIQWQKNTVFYLNERYYLKRVGKAFANQLNVFKIPENDVYYVFGGSNLSFKYQANRPSKTLKVWYQEWKISPAQRKQVPVFVYNNRAITIGLDPIKESCTDFEQTIYVELCQSANMDS